MKLFELLTILYVLAILLVGIVSHFLPLRAFLRVSPRTGGLLGGGLLLLCGAAYVLIPALRIGLGTALTGVAAVYCLVVLPSAFFLLKDQGRQTFFICLHQMCLATFMLGVGNWIGLWAEQGRASHLVNLWLVVRILTVLLCLPLSLYSLKRLFAAWSGTEAASFWKVVWLIPAALFTLNMLSGTRWNLTAENSMAFLLTRFFGMAALLACCAMMTGIMDQERELAAARMRKQMMDVADIARAKSHAQALTAWENTNAARQEAVAAVEHILSCVKTGSHDEIAALLGERMEGLASAAAGRLCENEAVNALALHYAAIARQEGIEVSFRLDIPRRAGRVQNVDLSRIVGNMLENAIEACRRMEYGARRIQLKSMIREDMLILVMDNSFDGDFMQRGDGLAVSRKRESGIATGLSSIRSVAERYDGTALFETDDRVFKTSVRLDMECNPITPQNK